MGNGKCPTDWLLLHPWIGWGVGFGKGLSVRLGLEDPKSLKPQFGVGRVRTGSKNFLSFRLIYRI